MSSTIYTKLDELTLVRLLIERIPLSQKPLAAALTKLVDNMSLDIISDLTQHYL